MKYVGRIAVVISDTYFICAFIGICVGDIKKGEFIWECNNSLVKIFCFFYLCVGVWLWIYTNIKLLCKIA